MTNSALTISPEQLQTTLTQLLGEDIQDLAPLGSGAWSRAFSFTHGGRPLVVRVGKHVDDFEKDRLAAAFTGPDLPIPHVLVIAPVPKLGDGLHACISTRAEGTFIDELDENGMRAMLPSLLATFDAMRTIDLSHTTGYGSWGADGNSPFASWRENLLDAAIDHPEHRGHGWLRKLEESEFGLDAWHILLGRLEASLDTIAPVADDIGRHVIHSDMLNFNMLCDAEGHRISALFDWGCALTGDPLYDLAWFAYWQPWYPHWQAIDFVGVTRDHLSVIGAAMPAFDERLRACMLHIGITDIAYCASIDRWDDVPARIARALSV